MFLVIRVMPIVFLICCVGRSFFSFLRWLLAGGANMLRMGSSFHEGVLYITRGRREEGRGKGRERVLGLRM